MKINESISELRKICQISWRTWADQPWAFLQIRKVSIYLTWVLLHVPVSANSVTLLGIATGLTASVLFGLDHTLIAGFMLIFSVLLDFSDGEVGRYRKELSKEGAYLDKIYHFTVHPSIFAGVTIAAFRAQPATWVVVTGFICVISVTVLTMARTYARWIPLWDNCSRLVRKLSAESEDNLKVQELLSNAYSRASGRVAETNMTGQIQGAKQSRLGRIVSVISGYWDFPYIFGMIIVISVIQQIIPVMCAGGVSFTPFAAVLFIYAITYPPLILLFVFYHVLTKSIGNDYDSFLSDLSSLIGKHAKK